MDNVSFTRILPDLWKAESSVIPGLLVFGRDRDQLAAEVPGLIEELEGWM